MTSQLKSSQAGGIPFSSGDGQPFVLCELSAVVCSFVLLCSIPVYQDLFSHSPIKEHLGASSV